MEKVCVIGAGHQGLTMAAHLSIFGCQVGLWNRTQSHIEELLNSGNIQSVGLYEQTVRIARVSSNINEVLTEVVMVTTPSSAHRDIAKLLAPYVCSKHLIVLNPGRTFGALEFATELINNGCKELPLIAESQTIVYTCRRDGRNRVSLYAMKKDVQISTLQKNKVREALSRIPSVLQPYFCPIDDYFTVTLNNVGMILHVAPLLFNIGWIENKKVDFKYYYDGITPTIAAFLEKLDNERLLVAKSLGCSIENVSDWLKRTYGTYGSNLYECLRNNVAYRKINAPSSLKHRYIEEDVPTGLVAFESVGRVLGINTPCMSLIIDLANKIMNTDYRLVGRDYRKLYKVYGGINNEFL